MSSAASLARFWRVTGAFAEDLASKKRTGEAAQILLDYAADVREASIALVEGSHFSEARRIVSVFLPVSRIPTVRVRHLHLGR